MLSVKIMAAGIWFALLAFVERVAPAARRPAASDGRRLTRNLGLWAANTLLSPFIIAPISIAAAALNPWTRPALPFGLDIVFDLLLLDLWTYAWHRANHEWAPLWRFHRVHHLDEFLDATSAVRFHPGEVVISALARAPLIVAADISIEAILAFETALLMAALFHHSNVRLPPQLEAALRLVVVTPSHHWVHHHARKADTDSNYGTVLTLWDRIFRSWSSHARTPEMKIGVEGEADVPLAALATAPFR